MEVIRRFEDHGAIERANKIRRRCGEVFRYATVIGRAKYNPASDLADAMKGCRKKNFPFLPADQIPIFNKVLATFSGSIVSLTATKVLRYTALRTKEPRSMLWKNIDSESRIIAVDANAMRGHKIHAVPMSDQVVEFLVTLSSITKPISKLVFVGRSDRRKPIRENAIPLVTKRISYESLEGGHGFRHEFSTIINGHEWSADATGVQLTYTNGGFVCDIYNHAQYLGKRREMMQWWADWPDEKVE